MFMQLLCRHRVIKCGMNHSKVCSVSVSDRLAKTTIDKRPPCPEGRGPVPQPHNPAQRGHMRYYHTYHRLPLKVAVTAGFVGWLACVLVAILEEKLPPSCRRAGES